MIAHHNILGLELKNTATQLKAIAKINKSFFIFIFFILLAALFVHQNPVITIE